MKFNTKNKFLHEIAKIKKKSCPFREPVHCVVETQGIAKHKYHQITHLAIIPSYRIPSFQSIPFQTNPETMLIVSLTIFKWFYFEGVLQKQTDANGSEVKANLITLKNIGRTFQSSKPTVVNTLLE